MLGSWCSALSSSWCRQHQIGMTIQYTWGQGSHPERPRQAGEMDWPRTSAQSCSYEGRDPCTNIGWVLVSREEALLERRWRLCQAEAAHEPAVCPDSRDGQQHPGLCSQAQNQHIERSDYTTSRRIQFWAPQHKKNIDKLDCLHQRATEIVGGQSTCPERTC